MKMHLYFSATLCASGVGFPSLPMNSSAVLISISLKSRIPRSRFFSVKRAEKLPRTAASARSSPSGAPCVAQDVRFVGGEKLVAQCGKFLLEKIAVRLEFEGKVGLILRFHRRQARKNVTAHCTAQDFVVSAVRKTLQTFGERIQIFAFREIFRRYRFGFGEIAAVEIEYIRVE